jgi:tetratricopeptide (TPR) repeat protein
MTFRPVFQNKFEVNIWKRLEADSVPQSRRAELYTDLAGSVIKREGLVNSSILVKIIQKLHETQNSNIRVLLPKLVSKSRSEDCGPALAAALVYLDMGDIGEAKDTVESVKHGQDIALIGCVKAKIFIKESDSDKAKKELMRARCSRPTYPMFYELIQQLEPNAGWMYRRNIELLVSGNAPIPCGESGKPSSAESLYHIYYNWYRGDKEEATRELISSEEYKEKNMEYVLASARMSVDEKDWHSAQRMYELILSKSSNCIYIICEAARSYYQGNNYDRALALYTDAAVLDPASHAVMNGLIRSYSALGKKEEAAQCIREFLSKENIPLESYFLGAKMLMDNGMLPDAMKIINEIFITYPEEPEAYVLKSEMEYLGGNINASLSTITEGIDHNPKDAECRLQKAKILYSTGMGDKAARELEKAQKLDPDNIGILLLMQEIAVNNNDEQEALRLSNVILELDPGNTDAMNIQSKAVISEKISENGPEVSYSVIKEVLVNDNRAENFINVLSSLVAEGKHQEAVQACRDKEREFGSIPIVRRLRGNAEFALGDFRRASDSYAAAAEADPTDPVLWHSKGMADEARGDLDAAEEAFNKATLLDMNDPDLWISRAAVQEKKDDLPGAVESLNKAIALKPDSSYALVRKGMIFAKLGEFAEAIYFVDMALVTDPKNAAILKVQRDICMAAGDYDRSSELAEEVLDCDPSDAEAVSDAVTSYVNAGLEQEAADLIHKALKKSPGSLQLLLIKKEFFTYMKDSAQVVDACERILEIQPDNRLVKTDLANALASRGMTDRADMLYSEIQYEVEVKPENRSPVEKENVVVEKKKTSDNIKRYSERVLRRAYIQKSALSDPDLMISLDIDQETADAVMNYLSDISPYGEIVPGTTEFDRMEKLSMNVLIKGDCEGLERDPVIPIPCAYVAGGTKDADEAKALVAYVYRAMTTRFDTGTCTKEVREAAESMPKGSTVNDIAKKYKVGAYQAKMIHDRI